MMFKSIINVSLFLIRIEFKRISEFYSMYMYCSTYVGVKSVSDWMRKSEKFTVNLADLSK